MKKKNTDPNQGELFPTGKQLRQEGMEASVNHANRVTPGWSDMAYEFLQNYADDHRGEEFLVEQVRWASADIVPEPPNTSAWGHIASKGGKVGMLTKLGAKRKKGAKAHEAFGTLWMTNPKWTHPRRLNGKHK